MTWPYTSGPDAKQTTSTALRDIPEEQLRTWLRKARRNGGVYTPSGWGRYFTVANMSADLARRRLARMPPVDE